jgi:hypothetical protein
VRLASSRSSSRKSAPPEVRTAPVCAISGAADGRGAMPTSAMPMPANATSSARAERRNVRREGGPTERCELTLPGWVHEEEASRCGSRRARHRYDERRHYKGTPLGSPEFICRILGVYVGPTARRRLSERDGDYAPRRVSVNREPLPGVLSSVSSPCMARARSLLMASPRPTPSWT